MTTVKIGRRGQITLPAALRRMFNLHEGDPVALIPQGESILIRPMIKTLFDLRGSIQVEEEQDFYSIRQQVQEERAKREVKDG